VVVDIRVVDIGGIVDYNYLNKQLSLFQLKHINFEMTVICVYVSAIIRWH